MHRLAILYSDFEGVLDSVMPSSRRANNNTYLQSMRGADKASIRRATTARELAGHFNGGSRYAKLNFTAHWKHGTVEFRHHAGTIGAEKACNWVKACLRMVVAAERDQAPVAVAAAAAAHNRPRGALGVIYDLCARPDGCTREEARVALGRDSAPRMQRLTDDAGIPLRRVGQRYFLAERPATTAAAPVAAAAAAAAAADVITLEGFCAKLAMPEDEAAFWKARQEFFAADTIGERVQFAPGTLAARRAGL